MHAGKQILSFEREITCRLILASRKLLPDCTGTTERLLCLRKSPARSRSVVIGMVSRGDFDAAVSNLTEVLYNVGADFKFDFSNITDAKVLLGIDSLLVVLEASLAAFTQLMIEMDILPPSAIEAIVPNFHSFLGLYHWASVSEVPALDPKIASELLQFIKRVMPITRSGYILIDSLENTSEAKLINLLLSTSQYIYMSNPAIVRDAVAQTLIEWEPPARKELLLLGNQSARSLVAYSKLVRSYLPRFDGDDQLILLHKVYVCLVRSLISEPTCKEGRSSEVDLALSSLSAAVDRTRSFKSLRAFRAYDSLVITTIEIMRKMAKASTETERRNAASVTSIRPFERATATSKKDGSSERRNTSQIAAICYFINIGFYCGLISERPNGEAYLIPLSEVAPYVPQMVDACDDLPESERLQLLFYCLLIKHYKLQQLVAKVSFQSILKISQLCVLVGNMSHLSHAFDAFSTKFAGEFRKAAKRNDISTIYTALCMLSRADPVSVKKSLIKTILLYTVEFIATSSLSQGNHEILTLYTMTLSDRFPNALHVKSLLPSISDMPTEKLSQTPTISRRIYLFLTLLAINSTVVPSKFYEDGEILHERAKDLRTALFIALCSDNAEIVDLALKSLERLQSDPHQSACERELLIEAIDLSDNSALAFKAVEKKLADAVISETDESFLTFSSAIREALGAVTAKTLSQEVVAKLLELRVVMLPLETPESRSIFYAELMSMNGMMLHAVSTSAHLSASLASEFLRTTTAQPRFREHLTDEQQVVGRSQIYTWLLKSLAGEHPVSTETHGLGELCRIAVMHLDDDSPVIFETSVLEFVEASAKYAFVEKDVEYSRLFGPVIDLILARKWSSESNTALGRALSAIFEKLRVNNTAKLLESCQRVSELDLGTFKTHPLTRLLHMNHEFAMDVSTRKIPANSNCRSCAYEASIDKFSESRTSQDGGVDSSDLVSYLLENIPVLVALCDVCSVNGDDTVAPSLVQLFKYSSEVEQCRLLSTAVAHEVDQSPSAYQLFRGNSVTMAVIIEWLRKKLNHYLTAILAPTLTALHTSLITDVIDLESFFEKGLKRFKSREFPPTVRWLINLIRRCTAEKFGVEIADQAVAFVIILRIICPAIISPKAFLVINRQPNRRFSTILRKYAGFIQRNKGKLYEYIQDGNNFADAGEAEDFQFNASDKSVQDSHSPGIPSEVDEDFTTSSRLVFHLSRRYSVEVRVILLSRQAGQYVGNMFRFLRIGKDQFPASSINSKSDKVELEFCRFRESLIISEKARNIATGHENFYKALATPESKNCPFLIDFTDYTLFFNLWVESLAQISHHIDDHRTEEPGDIYAVNCPRRTKSYILRLRAIAATKGINIKYSTSLDSVNEVDTLPPNLPELKAAAEDIKGAVKFSVVATVGRSVSETELEMYIGAKYIQFVGDGTCDVFPYVVAEDDVVYNLSIVLVKNESRISAGSSEFVVFNPTASLLRVSELSLIALEVDSTNAILDLASLKSPRRSRKQSLGHPSSPKSGTPSSSTSLHSAPTTLGDDNTSDTSNLFENMSPGTLIFWTSIDLFDDSENVRRSALDLYAALPETWGIQVNIPSSQQKLTISQINNLAIAAAKTHPESAFDVLCALSSLGVKINRVAAKVASPWVTQISAHTVHQRTLNDAVLRPLLSAASASPNKVSFLSLEYFWPYLRGQTQVVASLLIDAMAQAPPEAVDALRQIPTSMISVSRHFGAQEFVQIFSDKLYSCSSTPSSTYLTRWSQHPRWSEMRSALILFGSTSVDWKLAESLFCDLGLVVSLLAGIGPLQVRTTVHQLVLMHINALLQAPHITQFQRQKLLSARSESTSPRGCEVFGVPVNDAECLDLEMDDYSSGSPESIDYLGRLLTDIALGIFSNRSAESQEVRVAIATRIKEYVRIPFAPLQRRSILGLIGSVRMLMPGRVLAELVKNLSRLISLEGKDKIEVKGTLISAYLRMFSETVECVPDSGIYPRYLFWIGLCALASGCEKVQSDAVRLIRECVKIDHYRGSFKTEKMPQSYLSSRPNWVNDICNRLPFRLPSTEKNFHVALAVASVPVILKPESRGSALKCCEVLATASDGEYPYTCFLYMCGEEGKVITHVPIFECLDTADGMVRWLASCVKLSNPSTIITVALCAHISGFTTCNFFPMISKRLLNLIQSIPERRIVTMISPLLMPTFTHMLDISGSETEREVAQWTLSILSQDSVERSGMAADFSYLYNLVQSMDLTPWFSESSELLPLLQQREFTEFTAFVLGSDLRLWEKVSFDEDVNADEGELF